MKASRNASLGTCMPGAMQRRWRPAIFAEGGPFSLCQGTCLGWGGGAPASVLPALARQEGYEDQPHNLLRNPLAGPAAGLSEPASAHIRQSRPSSGLGFQTKDPKSFQVVLFSLGSGSSAPNTTGSPPGAGPLCTSARATRVVGETLKLHRSGRQPLQSCAHQPAFRLLRPKPRQRPQHMSNKMVGTQLKPHAMKAPPGNPSRKRGGMTISLNRLPSPPE